MHNVQHERMLISQMRSMGADSPAYQRVVGVAGAEPALGGGLHLE